MASQAIQALARRAESARNTLANLREKARIQEERAVTVAEVAVGAGVAGFVDGYFGTPKVFGIPAMVAVGTLMALGGLSGWIPGGMHMTALGMGLFSGPLYGVARDKGAEAAR